jgi:hypothetical protein
MPAGQVLRQSTVAVRERTHRARAAQQTLLVLARACYSMYQS